MGRYRSFHLLLKWYEVVWLVVAPSSGIPQHWQTSCRGDPSSVLMETSKIPESRLSVSGFGVVSPFSQRDTACRETKTFSASSLCDSPFFYSQIMQNILYIHTKFLLAASVAQIHPAGKQLPVSIAGIGEKMG